MDLEKDPVKHGGRCGRSEESWRLADEWYFAMDGKGLS